MQPQMAKKWQKKFTFRAGVINQIRPTSIENPSIFFFQLEELGRSLKRSSVPQTLGLRENQVTVIKGDLTL
jgi:hypothetical protein